MLTCMLTPPPPTRKAFARKFSALLKRTHIRQADIARALNVSRELIYGWTVGKSMPSESDLEKTAEFMRVSLDDLLVNAQDLAENVERNVSKPVPLFMDGNGAANALPFRGYVCAGTGSEYSDSVTFDQTDVRTLDIGAGFWNNKGKALSIIQVQGNSMEPTYYEGDLVVFVETRNAEEMRNGDHVIVDVGSGSMVLRVWFKEFALLSPINARQHDPIRWPERAMLVGIVQGLVRKIR